MAWAGDSLLPASSVWSYWFAAADGVHAVLWCMLSCLDTHAGACKPVSALQSSRSSTVATWTRPTPDKDETWTKPSYVPTPGQSPVITPYREDDRPLYTPSAPEFRPAELPEQQKEMPKGPEMPGMLWPHSQCSAGLYTSLQVHSCYALSKSWSMHDWQQVDADLGR